MNRLDEIYSKVKLVILRNILQGRQDATKMEHWRKQKNFEKYYKKLCNNAKKSHALC